MHPSIEEKNKSLVLDAFETLFNKRDYAAAERNEDAGRGFEHCLGCEVLAGDQLELRVLPFRFVLNGLVYLGIDLIERALHTFRYGHDG